MFTEQFEIFDGLSPHTRGTHESLAVTAFARRFIPAYAGNTWKRVFDRKQVPVYPRIRGEHGDMLANSAPPTGLSPHTRGTPSLCGTGSRNVRFIPAYAGNTKTSVSPSSRLTVYPRIRGEHLPSRGGWPLCSGLSPHTRGTLLLYDRNASHRRFIPAYAGNTQRARNQICLSPVYPRIRGEHVRPSLTALSAAGLSPHTRGTLAQTDAKR